MALDLGTTMIKAAALGEDGLLENIKSVKAPRVRGDGLIRESEAHLYLGRAEDLLNKMRIGLPEDIPIGLASQRSSFLLWERVPGVPVTPLISWEDRRADDWCKAHASDAGRIWQRTGLPLSPHYPGPKLAVLFENDPDLRAKARDGEIMFGQIDTYCTWCWCGVHQVDVSMASRTLCLDLGREDWSSDLLEFFGIPSCILPDIVPTCGRKLSMRDGGVLTSSVSDQAAGLIAVAGLDGEGVLVNLGTGGFVLSQCGSAPKRAEGYLTGPVLMTIDGITQFALEGTINGIGESLSWFDGEVTVPTKDPWPDVFCIPDSAGLGAPFWRADVSMPWSSAIEWKIMEDRARIIMEGIIFRVRQAIEDMAVEQGMVYLSGGLSNIGFIREGLAGCLGRPVHLLNESETTVLGSARLAYSEQSWPSLLTNKILPVGNYSYLADKYDRWKEWSSFYNLTPQ